MTGEIPSTLGNPANRNFRGLDLSENQLSGAIPPELGSLPSLTWLDLSGNALTGEIPSWPGRLLHLGSLRLGGNQLSGEIPSWLGSLPNLELLDLSGNELTGEIPPELSSLAKMRSLDLSRNQLSGAIPSWLGSLVTLQTLSLAGNQLSGAIPSVLGSLAEPCTALYLSWQPVDRVHTRGIGGRGDQRPYRRWSAALRRLTPCGRPHSWHGGAAGARTLSTRTEEEAPPTPRRTARAGCR